MLLLSTSDYNECQLDCHGCAHECVNTYGSYKCTCRVGYELESDKHNCTGKTSMVFICMQLQVVLVDIDECARQIDNCDQNCHNTIGSFYCSCNTSYLLNSNGYSCNGKLL